MSKLLKDGFFCSYPWNEGIGYMFRKNTPKLVFVFTNEYDNSFNIIYHAADQISSSTPWISSSATVVIPGVMSDKIRLQGVV